MHVRGLAKMAHEDPGNIQRELQKLEKIGFIKGEKSANTKVYSVNLHFALYHELQSLVLKSQAHQRAIAQQDQS